MEGFETAVLFAEGSTSQVFRARHEASGRDVAIKVLRAPEPASVRRFRFEADALRRLDHPGIARLVDAGEWAGRSYLATEFIDGSPIDRALAGASATTVARVFVKVLDALAHAHDRGLLHRDLKPANVLVRELDGEPQPVIVDFGLAADLAEPAATASGALLGTPAFMAPEQARGERARIDRHTDIYGAGAVLYATLTGRAPYCADSPGSIIAAILAGPPPRPGRHVPRRLEAISDCALARRPEARYRSARRFASDLEAWLHGQPVRAMRGFRFRLAGRAMARHAWTTAVIGFVCSTFVLLGAQQLWLKNEAVRQQERALRFSERLAESRARMRLAHLAPRHDLSPVRAALDREIAELRALAATRSLRADPSVRLVLGQLLLDSNRPEAAVAALREARALGCSDSRCAEALALGQLRLYERRLERELAFAPRQAAEAEPVELRRVRELLAEADPAAEAGLRLAALSQPLDEVARRAERALASEPWNYDALLALAESRYRAGLEAMRADRLESAMRVLRAAERDFERAADIARSMPDAYLGGCRARVRQVEIAATDANAVVANDLPDSCRLARRVLPGAAAAYSLPAVLLERVATRASRAGRHSRAAEALARAFAIVEEAPPHVRADPAVRTASARMLTTSVRVERVGEREAIARLREALVQARAATQAQPASTAAWHARAIAVALLAERDVEHAREFAREAEKTAAAVAERWPEQRAVRNLLGSTLSTLAWRQRLNGEPADETLARALAVLEPLVESAPDYDSARNNLGMALWERSVQLMQQGEPFAGTERRARAMFEAVLARSPDHPGALANLSGLNLSVADVLIERGEDPRNRLERSIELLGALAKAGDYLPCDLALAWWLRAKAVGDRVYAGVFDAAARAHAQQGDMPDCTRVLAAVNGDAGG
jgi:serine/threonine-protein kinase